MRAKEIFNYINDTHAYISDSAIKALAAVAFFKIEKEKNKKFSKKEINEIIKKIGVDFFDKAAKTFDIDNFKDFETTILEHYCLNEEINYKNFLDAIKDRIENQKS